MSTDAMTDAAVPQVALDPQVAPDPRVELDSRGYVSPQAQADAAVTRALHVVDGIGSMEPTERARWMRAVADALDAHSERIVATCDPETHLGTTRLTGEVARCATQWRFYADVAEEGGWLEATVDHATDTTPDLRRSRRPLGPVAVFGASNFPLAFGTLGNDTASAIAAGCPVVVKGHPAHPATHELLMQVALQALEHAGAPSGLLGAVTGFEAGQALVLHPGITAVSFTGSQHGGMALHALAFQRAVPVPVFAEMGTVNPVVVTPDAAARSVGSGAVSSFTLGMGQYCTKPGLLFVPAGSSVITEVIDSLQRVEPRGQLLTPAIAAGYVGGIELLKAAGATVAAYVASPGEGNAVSAVVMTAPIEALVEGSALLAECFGPVIVVVEYRDGAALREVLGRLQGTLVATVMGGGADDPAVPGLVSQLSGIAGRVTVDAWPTGVATTWAQHHGGPWPSTTSPTTTSVGARALDRFTRPVAYQGVPEAALPPALHDTNTWRIPRRVDGRVRTARATT